MPLRKAFTLIELLVVIAIIAVLAVVIILALNPADLLRQSRDSSRLSDLNTLDQAARLYIIDGTGAFGSSSVVYVSIPDPQATSTAGDQCQGLSLPALTSPWTYHCSSAAQYKKVDGTGWMPINFSLMTVGSSLSSLPVDPVNKTSTSLYYTYTTDGKNFDITTALESQKYSSNCSKDNGQYSDLCERGGNLTLLPYDYAGGGSSGGTPSSHIYWRLLISSQNGANNTVVVSELMMFDVSGTYLNTSGTSTASSCYTGCGGSYPASNAFNGNDADWWNANNTPTGGSPEWLQYQFPSAKGVAAFLVEGRGGTQDPMTFKLQYSDDGSSWTDASAVFNPVWGSYWRSYTFPATTVATGNYLNWRTRVTTTGGGASASGAEIQLRTTVSGSQAATGGRANSDSDYGGSGSNLAFDGNTATLWSSYNNVPQSIDYAFTKALSIKEITWQSRSDCCTNQNPTAFTLEGSNDGLTWTSIAPFTSTNDWTASQIRTFDVP